MEPFALSERWNGWSGLDVILKAARAAVAAGPLDPLLCEVVIESDFDTVTVDSLDAAQAHLRDDPDPMSIEIMLAHVDEAEGLRVLVPERLPPNDGQIAYGQVAVAAARHGIV